MFSILYHLLSQPLLWCILIYDLSDLCKRMRPPLCYALLIKRSELRDVSSQLFCFAQIKTLLNAQSRHAQDS
jgi:hypothetical protein